MALGYGLGNGIRFELEGDYRNNRFSQGRDFGAPTAAGGNEIKYGPMVNALYDLTGLIPFPYAAPYAGVGVGYQWSHFDKVHTYGSTGFPRLTSDDTRGALAYQAIIGAVIPFQFLPGLATTIEYRFLGLAHRDYDLTATRCSRRHCLGQAEIRQRFQPFAAGWRALQFWRTGAASPRRPRRLRPRPLLPLGPTWCSLTGTRRH